MTDEYNGQVKSKYCFTIQTSPFGKIMIIVCCCIFVLLCIGIILGLKESLKEAYSFTPALIIGFLVGVSDLALIPLILCLNSDRIMVDGTDLAVKTLAGKEHVFTCADISKVRARKGIHIYTRNNGFLGTVNVPYSEKGISQLADYLLVQLEKGTIKESAVSPKCVEALERYKKGELYAPVKRK